MSRSFDQEFIDMMVPHHEAGIKMAKLAEQRAEHASLHRFASDMIAAQSSEIRQMEDCRTPSAAGMETTEMDHSAKSSGMGTGKMGMEKVMRDLQTADAFDKAFLKAMIPHHRMAIDMAEPAVDKVEKAQLKELARNIAEVQSREVTRMKGWLRDWK